MEIKGLLEGKQDGGEGIGKNGKPWHRYVFVVDGKKYSCFDKKKYDALTPGQSVKILGEQGEQYFDLKDIIVDDAVEVVKPGAMTTPEYPKEITAVKEFHLSPEECRCRALECAIKCDAEKILDKAKEFLEFIENK